MTGRNFLMRADKVDKVVVPTNSSYSGNVGQRVICSIWDQTTNWSTKIFTGVQHLFPMLERYPWCSVVAKQKYIHKLGETADSIDVFTSIQDVSTLAVEQGLFPLEQGLYRKQIASIDGDPDIALINSSSTDEITDAIIDADGDVLLLQANLRPGDFVIKRLTTTLGEHLCRSLFTNCVDGLLSLDSQSSFGEDAPKLRIQDHIQNEVVTDKMDFTEAMGTYFREIFFHTPFLIADQLNSQQNFDAALQWFRYIFDPTADDAELLDKQQESEIDSFDDDIDADDARRAGFKAEDNAKVGKMDARDKAKAERAEAEEEDRDKHRKDEDRERTEKDLHAFRARLREEAERDRVWRFIEFRGLDVPSLRKILTEAAAIATYEQNPFNPHAIARLRLSAYQKCIVMNYIGVLIEWGDTLFTEFHTETVNEATLLYDQALEILGSRPVEVGDCGEGNENERTYEAIARTFGKGSQFLVEMETYTLAGTGAARSQSNSRPQHQYVLDSEVANYYRKEAMTGYRRRASAGTHHAPAKEEQAASMAHASSPDTENRHAAKAKAERGAAHPFHRKVHHGAARNASSGKAKKGLGRKQPSKSSGGHAPKFASSVVRHIGPAFCVPPNTNLLSTGTWSRIAFIRFDMEWILPARYASFRYSRR
jgi:hypothetical protein